MNRVIGTTILTLGGLDGSNLLAFLAALGTLRTLSGALPREPVALSWTDAAGAWRPTLHLGASHTEESIVETLDAHLRRAATRAAFAIGDDLTLAASEFREHVSQALNQALAPEGGTRDEADFLAAFGCEACAHEDGTMEDTDLRTMSGAGHQHFLKFFRDLVRQTEASHLARALLNTWDYADDGRGLNLRWDPADDRRYALRWDDPSGDPIKTMRGANRLAMEALPLLPTMPTLRGLATTGFEGSGARDTTFVWPLWGHPLPLDVVRSLLAASLPVRDGDPIRRADAGIVAVFGSRRINPTPKYRNFTPARPL